MLTTDVEICATNLGVWLGDGNPALLDADWLHLTSEVRAASATLDEGTAPTNADTFDVDGVRIDFTAQ